MISKKEPNRYIKPVLNFLVRVRFLVAIALDFLDFFFAWIPVLNSVWDIVTFLFLMVTLKNKQLASISLAELVLIGFPPFSTLDAFIPMALILTTIDSLQTEVVFVNA